MTENKKYVRYSKHTSSFGTIYRLERQVADARLAIMVAVTRAELAQERQPVARKLWRARASLRKMVALHQRKVLVSS